MIIISRNLLNASARSARILAFTKEGFPHTVKNLTTGMKLFSIVGVPFSIFDLKAVAQKIFNSFSASDKEGVALGTLSFSIIALDIFDSVTTFVNATLRLTSSSLSPLQLFTSLDLPIGVALVGMGTLSRTIQVVKTFQFNRNIGQYAADTAKLKAFVHTTLNVEKVALQRFAPKSAVDELEELSKLLTTPDTDVKPEDIAASVGKIQQELCRKMKLDTVGIGANLFVLNALRLFSVGAAGPLPFLLLAGGFGTRLGVLAYQDYIKKP